jgi:hypothetical protein
MEAVSALGFAGGVLRVTDPRSADGILIFRLFSRRRVD